MFIKIFILLLLSIGSLHAQTIEVLQELNFGKITVKPVREPSFIKISRFGAITIQNHIWLIEQGHRAEFALTNYPPNTELYVNVIIHDTMTKSALGGEVQLEIKDLDYKSSVTTNAAGYAHFYVGGALHTTNNHLPYKNTDYRAKLELEISY